MKTSPRPPRIRLGVPAALVLTALCGFAVRHEGAPAPAAIALKPLEKAAREVAKGGRTAELDELLELLRRCGMDDAAHQKLAAACRADAAKAKKVAPSLPSTAKALQKAAADLAAKLAAIEPPQREELAQLVLRIDSHSEPAQRALGREQLGEQWLDATGRARHERRQQIASALAEARRLPIEVVSGPSKSRWFAAAKCKTPNQVRLGAVTVHGVWEVSKLERCMREAGRALAFANFLLTGKVAVPTLAPHSLTFFDEKPEYENALILALEAGRISERDYDEATELSGTFVKDEYLGYELIESDLSSLLLVMAANRTGFLLDRGPFLRELQPGIVGGLLNYVALSMLGTRLPLFAIEEEKETRIAVSRTSGLTEAERVLRERLFKLADAGIAGGRAWLEHLAARREDPPLENAFVDQIGRLQGDDLLKATFVFEMLAEDGPALTFLRKVPCEVEGKTPSQVFEAACGRKLPEFEAAWRDWFVPARPGLAQRLGAVTVEDKLSADEKATVDYLGRVREAAGLAQAAVDFDRPASDSCRHHALYLERNPDQLERWPDAHEEYPDRELFAPAGAWAGTHSVIAPGVRDGVEAIDDWMATFYHRLPLLDPGLVRIGYAMEDHCAVLDCGSFVRPRDHRGVTSDMGQGVDVTWWAVVWPAPDATGVPSRFQAELPEPVPGEDESKMGYPVTFQLLYRFDGRRELTLELREGSPTGKVLPSFFSTPTNPTNPKIAPDDSWCLIPKWPLDAGRTYFVRGKLTIVANQTVTADVGWSFRCGG